MDVPWRAHVKTNCGRVPRLEIRYANRVLPVKALIPNFVPTQTWPLILGVLLAALFLIAFEISEVYIFLHAQRASVIAVGALAYLMINDHSRIGSVARSALYVIACLVILRFVVQIPAVLATEPKEWDFLCFYLDSHVASAGLNLYQPASYLEVATNLNLQVSDYFRREILDVGFKYPPPTALLFLPLSQFEIETAKSVWFTLVIVSVFVACMMLSRLIVTRNAHERTKISVMDSVAFAAVIVFSVTSTRANVVLGQTVPILCSLITLTLIGSGNLRSGVWACLSVFIKPIAVIPALVLLIGRYWLSILSGVLVGLLLLVISAYFFGIDDWLAYIRQEYATTSPAWLYLENNNKSLLAVISRGFGISDVPWGNGAVVASYGVVSLIVAVPTIWLASKTARTDFLTSYCLLLLMGLIVYPGTQTSYGMLLIIPIALEFWNQNQSTVNKLIPVTFVVLAVMISNLYQFAGTVLIWLVFVFRALLVLGWVGRIRPAVLTAETWYRDKSG